MNINTIVLVLVILIVITISYLVFSIWNTFISKKQVTMSIVDHIYGYVLGFFVGMYTNKIIIFAIAIIVYGIWLMLISLQWKRNDNKKTKAKVF